MSDGIPKNIEEVDTAPILDSKTVVEFETIELGSYERAEVVLAPKTPIRKPTLYIVPDPKSSVLVEQMLHGNVPIFDEGNTNADKFKFGYQLNVMVTDNEYIKIIVKNILSVKATVNACLVCEGERTPVGLYRMSFKDEG